VLYGLTLLFPPAVASWRIVIYGAILVAVLVLKPEGFITRRLVLTIERLLSSKRKKI
jgi:ABC-type branched-subunit amino acid transport system permease subunit